MNTDFYTDLRFCEDCRSYVPYLQSLSGAYCVQCGQPVRLFSPTGLIAFRRSVFGARYVDPSHDATQHEAAVATLP